MACTTTEDKTITGLSYDPTAMKCTKMVETTSTMFLSNGITQIGDPTIIPSTEDGTLDECCLKGDED